MPSLFSAPAAGDCALIEEPLAPLRPFPGRQRLSLEGEFKRFAGLDDDRGQARPPFPRYRIVAGG